MRIAWCITGGGYQLRESVELLEKLVEEPAISLLDIFISLAGETVLNMYQLLERLKSLKNFSKVKTLLFEKNSPPGFPVVARCNVGYYDLLVVSPLTANSAAKINACIADTLITSMVAQMVKGRGKIILIPTDLVEGPLVSEIPGNRTVKIYIDKFNASIAQELTKFPGITVHKSPDYILDYISIMKR